MTKQYWICVTNQKNWDLCLKHRTWGTVENVKSSVKKAQKDIIMIVYLKGFFLAGICRFIDSYFYDEKIIWEDLGKKFEF